MTPLPWTWRTARHTLCSGLAFSCLLSCEPSNKVKAGPPELVLFAPIGPNGAAADVNMPVSARSRIAAVFDRVLEPSKLVEIDDGGLKGKAMVVDVMSNIGKQPNVDIAYTPNGDVNGLVFSPAVFGTQTGPNIIASLDPTLPSGAQITATLAKEKITSKAGEPFVVAVVDGAQLTQETLSFMTEPLAVTFAPAPDADAGATCATAEATGDNSILTLTFNNLLATSTATIPATDDILSHVTVSAKDANAPENPAVAVEFTATTDGADTGLASAVTIKPGSAGWPVGATVTVTVDAKAQDVAGGTPLGTASSGCFTVVASSDGGHP